MRTMRLLPLLLVLAQAPPAMAAQVPMEPLFVDLVEVMMDSQAATLSMLVRRFGAPAEFTGIEFTSSFDPDFAGFSFAPAAGATFFGLNLALSVSGALDTASGAWTFQAAGQIDGDAFNGGGTGQASGGHGCENNTTYTSDWKVDFLDGEFADWHSTTTCQGNGFTVISHKDYRETWGGITSYSGLMRNAINADTEVPRWSWRTVTRDKYEPFAGARERAYGVLLGAGEADPATGRGRFGLFASVPEVPTAWLLALALPMLVTRRRH